MHRRANNILVRKSDNRRYYQAVARYNYTPAHRLREYGEGDDYAPGERPLRVAAIETYRALPNWPHSEFSRAPDVPNLIAAVDEIRRHLGPLPVQYNGPEADGLPEDWQSRAAFALPDPPQSPAQRVLDRAIVYSGLSPRRFARQHLARDERTVRQWRSGLAQIPDAVEEWLRRYLETTPAAG